MSDPERVTLLSAGQLSNAYAPSLETESGRLTLFRLVQFSNAAAPMVVRELDNLMSFRPEQPLKALLPISLTVFGSLTEEMAVQVSNALASILVTGTLLISSGMLSDSRLLFFRPVMVTSVVVEVYS